MNWPEIAIGIFGVAYLTTGMIASGKLKTIDTHNAVISPTFSSHGVGVHSILIP